MSYIRGNLVLSPVTQRSGMVWSRLQSITLLIQGYLQYTMVSMAIKQHFLVAKEATSIYKTNKSQSCSVQHATCSESYLIVWLNVAQRVGLKSNHLKGKVFVTVVMLIRFIMVITLQYTLIKSLCSIPESNYNIICELYLNKIKNP